MKSTTFWDVTPCIFGEILSKFTASHTSLQRENLKSEKKKKKRTQIKFGEFLLLFTSQPFVFLFAVLHVKIKIKLYFYLFFKLA